MSNPNDTGVNPPFNGPPPPPMSKAELFFYHAEAGTLEAYYSEFPEDAPGQAQTNERGGQSR